MNHSNQPNTRYSTIIGYGASLPQNKYNNRDISTHIDTSDEWIVSRTGIKQRHLVSEEETLLSLSLAASQEALQCAGCLPKDIDTIIFATTTSDQKLPSMACKLQEKLLCPEGRAFDIQAACSGFIYALELADMIISQEKSQRILVVGGDIMSRSIDWSDRTTCILFGDGVGAVVMSSSPTSGIVATETKANGQGCDALSWAHFQSNQPYLTMKGKEVFRMAIEKVPKLILSLIAKARWQLDEVDWIIPHQANQRILEKIATELDFPLEKMIITVGHHANTSAASIPLALNESLKSGLIKPGHKILLIGFGAGFTWGGIAIVWSK